ncbi:unnamed protein product [Strongylus vulgaris]|uniref:MoaB/Mog domain-containing protein n=1 Tax=Strongylus vulgaris TaxID=40348 RepID=A0A3P7JP72_STRVU|nr:unnamed protein product [Strongylus vulgaris]
MDTNSHFICSKLHELGVQVKKISAIGDSVDDISDEIRQFSCRYDYVFTTGGVGPTHDDKTYLVRLSNVISLPGVPRFCERAFLELKEQLFPSSQVKPLYSKTLYTSRDERTFAEKLASLASKYEDIVEIGSYPVMKNR